MSLSLTIYWQMQGSKLARPSLAGGRLSFILGLFPVAQ